MSLLVHISLWDEIPPKNGKFVTPFCNTCIKKALHLESFFNKNLVFSVVAGTGLEPMTFGL